jgi:hypothetical protein
MAKEVKTIIKQIDNPDNPGIGIKYVGSNEYATPKVGKDGKIITGVDEFALSITTLPDTEQKKKTAEIKKLRENLEKLLGVDLTPQSDFWTEFMIVLNDDVTLDPTNPKDLLSEKFLIANRYVAPSKLAIREDDYENCLFFLYREEEEITRSAQNYKNKDRATAKLFNLMEGDPLKLKIVASYIFGFDAHLDLSVEEAYVKLKDFLDVKDEDAQVKNIATFISSCDKTPEEMILKQILDKSVKRKIVSAKGGIYRRGDTIYGNSHEEALEYLSLPEHSGEVSSLKRAVDN